MPPEQLEPVSLPAPPSFALLSAEGGPYRTLLDALDYGVLLYDLTATVLVHNASAERVLGLSAPELTGRAPLPPGWALFYENGSPLTQAAHPVLKVFQTGRVLRDQVIRVAHRDGRTGWLQVTVQPLFAESDAPYAAVASMIEVTTRMNDIPKFRLWTLGVAFFGSIFLGFQVYEFSHFVHEGLTLQQNLFGSTFFTLTGTHGVHVTIGVLWLVSLLIISYVRPMTSQDALSVEIAGLYWHFVDIVWIVIFTAVYLVEFI